LMLITLLMFLPKASANPVNDFGLKLKTWWANEKAETIYFQKGKREEVGSFLRQFTQRPSGRFFVPY